MKRKTTIKLALFSEWDPHGTNCQICNKVKLLQKVIIGTQKTEVKKKNLWVKPKQKLIYGHNLP